MAETKTIFKLEVQASDALNALYQAEQQLIELKKRKKELEDEMKKNGGTEETIREYTNLKTQIRETNGVIKENQKVVDNQIKANKQAEGSINQMRSNLKNLRAEYENLSAAERNGAKGQEMLKHIKEQTDELKALEGAQGDFRRNVGNYSSIWEDQAAGFTSLGDVMSKVFGANSIFGKLGGIMKTAGTSIGFVAREVKNTSDATTQANNTITDSVKTMSSSVSQSYTEVGKSITSVGTAAEDGTKVVQGFGKELYNTTDGTKATAEAAKETTTAVEGMGTAATTTAAAETAAGAAATGMAGGFKTAAVAVKGLAKQMLSLLANPYVAAIAAIVVVVMKLVDAIKKNDAAMTALQSVMSAFKPIIDIINKAFTALVGVVTKAMEAISSAVQYIMQLIPGLAEYSKAEEDVVRSTDALEDSEREYTINSAKRQAEIAKLREEAADREKYSFEQRKEFMQQALELEKEELEEKKSIAEEKYRIAEQQALMDIGFTEMSAEAWNNLSDEVKDSLTDLKAAAIQAETDYSNAARTFVKQMSTFTKQEEAERKQRAAAAASAAKERKKNEQQALRDLEDLYINSIKDMSAKEIAQMKEQTNRKIEDLKVRIKTEQNLTVAAKKALNRQITLLEADLQIKIGEIQQRYSSQQMQQQLQDRIEYYKNLFSSLSTEEAKVKVNIEINDLETELLEKQYKEKVYQVNQIVKGLKNDIISIESDTLDQDAIEGLQLKYRDELFLNQIDSTKSFHDQLIELQKIYHDRQQKLLLQTKNNLYAIRQAGKNERIRLLTDEYSNETNLAIKHAEILSQIEANNGLDTFYYNELEKTKIMEKQAADRVEVAKRQMELIRSYTKEEALLMYGSIEAWNTAIDESYANVQASELALKDATQQVIMAQQAQKDAMISNATAIMGSFNNIASSFQSLFEQMAEGDEKYSKYATAMAMMQILVSTAISIANAIQGATSAAAAAGPAAPVVTPVFIAEMVAIVSGALVSATTTLMKAKQQQPSTPQFSQGGLVGTQTTNRTDDTVNAKLSLGEYVIQSKVVDALGVDFFDALNGKKKLRFPGDYRFASGGLVSAPSAQAYNTTTDMEFNYRIMGEVFAEAVEGVTPVVSVKEITTKQNRVKIKENTASYR